LFAAVISLQNSVILSPAGPSFQAANVLSKLKQSACAQVLETPHTGRVSVTVLLPRSLPVLSTTYTFVLLVRPGVSNPVPVLRLSGPAGGMVAQKPN
jgi:hypothetical protein